jgi:hypothetical protein
MGVLFLAAVVLAGDPEPSAGPTAEGSQTNTFLPLVMLSGGGTCSAGVPRTGQTPTVPLNPAPAGSDGALQKGVAWPNPRFTDNKNGTVTDNLTGLVWLQNANCTDAVGKITKSLNLGALTWDDALTWSNNLANGSCGLTDGSTAGQWRLPNLREMQSLIDYSRFNPALPLLHPFTGVQVMGGFYWSSTTWVGSPSNAWEVFLFSGWVDTVPITDVHYVWPVRGGQ